MRFQDHDFPPDLTSLVGDISDPKSIKKLVENEWDQIEWKRVTEIPSLAKNGELAIFNQRIEPTDVQ